MVLARVEPVQVDQDSEKAANERHGRLGVQGRHCLANAAPSKRLSWSRSPCASACNRACSRSSWSGSWLTGRALRPETTQRLVRTLRIAGIPVHWRTRASRNRARSLGGPAGRGRHSGAAEGTADQPAADEGRVRACCGRSNGSLKLAERIGVPKSQVSRWLRRAEHRFSLACLLDMCASEGFELAKLLMGDLARTAWRSEVRPERQRRQFKYHDHRVIEEALRHAIDTGASISSVAEGLGVDVSTLARHEELYAAFRDRNQALSQQLHADAQRAAVAEAEQVILALSRQGQTPTLRDASDTTGSRWYPAQLRAIALHALRMRMGAANCAHSQRCSTSARTSCASSTTRPLGCWSSWTGSSSHCSPDPFPSELVGLCSQTDRNWKPITVRRGRRTPSYIRRSR